MTASWAIELERRLATDDDGESLAITIVVLAAAAGEEIAIPPAEVHGAVRRALLLLAAGGDPQRGLDLNGRPVTALADELRTADRQIALERALSRLKPLANGLPHVSEALHGLMHAPEIAWRAFASSLLADALGADD